MTRASIQAGPTLLLKAVILVLGSLVLVLCGLLFPLIYTELWEAPQFAAVIIPALIGIYATPVPFFFALYQAFRLLHFIDANHAFSEQSVAALRRIMFCGIAMSACYAICMPLVVLFAELDDAPGAIIIGMAIVVAPLIVATFSAVLQKLIRSAMEMKAENDFTI